MKIIKHIFFPSLIFFSCISFGMDNPGLKTSLSGTITEKGSGEKLIGATIYFPDLKMGTVTDTNGLYFFGDLPKTKILIQVSFIGYKTISEMVDLNLINQKDFVLEPSVREMDEVVVSGLSKATEKNRTPTSIVIIPKITLLQNSSTNIIDAIATQPGISQITTGAGISKPVIRGLGFNRVVVVNDGIRQEGQQWGDEHGIEIDEYSVGKVEILKGPASMSFGSDAMAGVINFISAPNVPEGNIKGSILGNYQSNNGLLGYSSSISGNNKGITWTGRYSSKMSHSYKNRYDGYVLNSGMKENSLGGEIGFNKSWGNSHLIFSSYHLKTGITEGERDSLTGKFIKHFALNDSIENTGFANEKDFFSYLPFVPFQDIRHKKFVLNNSFTAWEGRFKTILGYQENERKEYTNILAPEIYGLYFRLSTINYDFRYLFPEKNNLNVTLGINGMQQHNQNKGTEFLIPAYQSFDAGSFIFARKELKQLDLSGGLRFDVRTITSDDLWINEDSLTIKKFEKFEKLFYSETGSLGASYSLNDNLILKLKFSRGYRAPNITELSANGVHEGALRYILGNRYLRAEKSFQEDLGVFVKNQHISLEISLFSNSIQNYIFLHKISAERGGDSITVFNNNPYPTFTYSSGNATLSGGEVLLDVHPHPFDWLHFENSFAYVTAMQSHQPDSTKYLPFTPGPKISSDIRADLNFKKKEAGTGKFIPSDAYIKAGMDYFLKQDKFYAAYNTETLTPGYFLFNLGTGGNLVIKGKTIFSLFISVNNLFDVAYQSHLSRLKYMDENYSSGRVGVYNMGRNVGIKFVVPVG